MSTHTSTDQSGAYVYTVDISAMRFTVDYDGFTDTYALVESAVTFDHYDAQPVDQVLSLGCSGLVIEHGGIAYALTPLRPAHLGA